MRVSTRTKYHTDASETLKSLWAYEWRTALVTGPDPILGMTVRYRETAQGDNNNLRCL